MRFLIVRVASSRNSQQRGEGNDVDWSLRPVGHGGVGATVLGVITSSVAYFTSPGPSSSSSKLQLLCRDDFTKNERSFKKSEGHVVYINLDYSVSGLQRILQAHHGHP
nr:hypothetical protein CFP56_54461 [Quercus suber]